MPVWTGYVSLVQCVCTTFTQWLVTKTINSGQDLPDVGFSDKKQRTYTIFWVL